MSTAHCHCARLEANPSLKMAAPHIAPRARMGRITNRAHVTHCAVARQLIQIVILSRLPFYYGLVNDMVNTLQIELAIYSETRAMMGQK